MAFEYFTKDELRALPDMGDADLPHYDDDRLSAAHDWIAAIVERVAGTSFVVRTVTDEKHTGRGCDPLFLEQDYVREVTAATVDGVAFTSDQLDALAYDDGMLYRPDGYEWTRNTRGNVLVSYTYGYSTAPPADLKEAMMRGARNWVLTSAAWSGKDSRATSITNEYGNVQLTTASEDRPTGLPDVDATIMSWARKVRVPKVA